MLARDITRPLLPQSHRKSQLRGAVPFQGTDLGATDCQVQAGKNSTPQAMFATNWPRLLGGSWPWVCSQASSLSGGKQTHTTTPHHTTTIPSTPDSKARALFVRCPGPIKRAMMPRTSDADQPRRPLRKRAFSQDWSLASGRACAGVAQGVSCVFLRCNRQPPDLPPSVVALLSLLCLLCAVVEWMVDGSVLWVALRREVHCATPAIPQVPWRIGPKGKESAWNHRQTGLRVRGTMAFGGFDGFRDEKA
ncbi:hypothetical protein B0T25DRAFT_127257 [Lasiosphaeria hispida]|uniref:Uncharacterized protein n=1 Tax=Lasiosphaeria hispida TaxID=260671 RepID=A0AAJ0HRV2_9PEZI|nr:hypothetical protein B0T25DRAFT_127257 [Lasiosphaeria hispida]